MEKTKEFRMRVKLKGKNRIRSFRQLAKRLASHVASHEHVTGMVLLGGIARGFTDRTSDLDGMVFFDEKDELAERQIRDMAARESKKTGIDIDLEAHLFGNFEKWRWNEINRWDFSHALIAFDKKGQVKRTIEARTRAPPEFWIKRMVTCAEYMKWYCCPLRENIETIAEAWIDRGDLCSAHYCVNYGVELILKAVFALNKEFLPPPKWWIFYFRNLRWLPRNHVLLSEAMRIRELSADDLRRRLEAVKKMWAQILSKIEKETGLGQQEIDKYYVERILEQHIPI